MFQEEQENSEAVIENTLRGAKERLRMLASMQESQAYGILHNAMVELLSEAHYRVMDRSTPPDERQYLAGYYTGINDVYKAIDKIISETQALINSVERNSELGAIASDYEMDSRI